MQLIDTHVHVNFDKFEPDLDAVASRWRENGVVHLVHSCCHPDEFAGIQALANKFPELSFSVGMHPLEAHRWTPESEGQILELARSDSRVVAIGEAGLDFYKADNKQLQAIAFEAQLRVARELNMPIIIHCRDASSFMARVLRDFWESDGPVSGVMHCWSGTPEETRLFLDLGFYISFSGIVSFKNASVLRAAIAIVPEERLLIETDCPFLAPHPYRGKRNEPAYVQFVARAVADIRGESLANIAEITTRNACRLFNLSVMGNGFS